MPSRSRKQSRFMRAAAHSKEFADKVGIDMAVAQDFVQADKKEDEKKGKKKKD